MSILPAGKETGGQICESAAYYKTLISGNVGFPSLPDFLFLEMLRRGMLRKEFYAVIRLERWMFRDII